MEVKSPTATHEVRDKILAEYKEWFVAKNERKVMEKKQRRNDYLERNKEKIQERGKIYREKNKDKIKERNNRKGICEICNCEYTNKNKARHQQSRKCQVNSRI